MSDSTEVSQHKEQEVQHALALVALTPECLSAALMVDSKLVGDADIFEVVAELRRQCAAINKGDLTRAENMLIAQAHTLDRLFADLAAKAMRSSHSDGLERYMRLAFKAQNQARNTLQTLAELKSPRQVAFVQQANIGNQVQVNNDALGSHAREENKKSAKRTIGVKQ